MTGWRPPAWEPLWSDVEIAEAPTERAKIDMQVSNGTYEAGADAILEAFLLGSYRGRVYPTDGGQQDGTWFFIPDDEGKPFHRMPHLMKENGILVYDDDCLACKLGESN